MTKKDYIRLADALVAAHPCQDKYAVPTSGGYGIALRQWRECAEHIANALMEDNSKFDSGRFREYIAAKLGQL